MSRKIQISAIMISQLVLLAGCQQDIVQRRANKLTSTVPNLYYEQVLDNIALNLSDPSTMPYFGVPTQSTHANTRQYQANYMPSFDYITSIMPHKYLFDKQALGLMGMVQNQESVQLTPITSPDKLLIMRLAYKVVTNQSSAQDRANDLDKLSMFYGKQTYLYDYQNYIQKSDWFCSTTSWKEAKRNRADRTPIGYNNGVYVYVKPGKLNELTLFTMSILDIATLDTDVLYGYKKMAGMDSGSPPPRQHFSPVAPPYLSQ